MCDIRQGISVSVSQFLCLYTVDNGSNSLSGICEGAQSSEDTEAQDSTGHLVNCGVTVFYVHNATSTKAAFLIFFFK